MDYQFILEPYKSMKNIYKCPACHKKSFTRYIDTTTNEYVHDDVGRCSREIKCGYHYPPKAYFEENKIYSNYKTVRFHKKEIKTKPKEKPFSTIPTNRMQQSQHLNKTSQNNFISYLKALFKEDFYEITDILKKYKVGTSSKWKGATIFWQIDAKNRIRTGKIMLYNPKTGKRVKKPFNHIYWEHKILATNPNKTVATNTNNEFVLKQCLFGEHLLKMENEKTIGIVESEKTAILSSIFYPDFLWLATGGLNNLTHEKTKVLEARNVILFPDLSAYDKWEQKSRKLSPKINLKIYETLETFATNYEKQQGYDIGDYFLKIYEDFRKM